MYETVSVVLVLSFQLLEKLNVLVSLETSKAKYLGLEYEECCRHSWENKAADVQSSPVL